MSNAFEVAALWQAGLRGRGFGAAPVPHALPPPTQFEVESQRAAMEAAVESARQQWETFSFGLVAASAAIGVGAGYIAKRKGVGGAGAVAIGLGSAVVGGYALFAAAVAVALSDSG